MSNKTEQMYIHLLKNCILDNIYGSIVNDPWSKNKDEPATKHQIDNGTFWPLRAHTMIGIKRMENIEYCISKVYENNIDGDFIETGVWRGGACIFMAGLNKIYNMNRKIYVADSFTGLPDPDPKYPIDTYYRGEVYDYLKVSEEQVRENFKRYDLLDDHVIFIKGYFEHSLKGINIDKLSILRLDGDMYSSTIQVLDELYDKVSIGGFIIVDDFGGKECKQAICDFRTSRNITTPYHIIDDTGMFWQKS